MSNADFVSGLRVEAPESPNITQPFKPVDLASEPILEFASLLKPVPSKETLSKLARTELEIEELKAQAREQGFAEGRIEGVPVGHREGYEAGYEEGLRRRAEETNALLTRVEGALEVWFKNAEPGLAQLAVLISQRIISKELTTEPETIMSMVKEAVSEVTHATCATIRVRISDKDLLETRRQEILSSAPSLKELIIVDDPDLVGGCMIETDGGVVDATVDMKFNVLLEALRGAA